MAHTRICRITALTSRGERSCGGLSQRPQFVRNSFSPSLIDWWFDWLDPDFPCFPDRCWGPDLAAEREIDSMQIKPAASDGRRITLILWPKGKQKSIRNAKAPHVHICGLGKKLDRKAPIPAAKLE